MLPPAAVPHAFSKEYIYTNEPAADGRGHKVTVYESSKLGGQWNLAVVPPYKWELATFLEWQRNELKRLGVDVKLNTEFTEDMLIGKEEAVIIATERKKVGIFEMLDAIAKGGESSVNWFLFNLLDKFNVDQFVNATVKRFSGLKGLGSRFYCFSFICSSAH